MAGGPVFPFSALPVTAPRVFPNVHVGATNGRREQGMGVEASLGANGTWALRFEMPQVLPSGTAKLRLLALAAATANAAKVNPTWGMCAVEESPDTITLTGEGTQTITWGAGDTDQYKELIVTLDADTIVASEFMVMNLVFETTGWTLTVVSTWQASIIWE
jgi:hypothetical protein